MPVGAEEEEIERETAVGPHNGDAFELRTELALAGLAAHIAGNLLTEACIKGPQ
jgi:hypothetical protein